MHPWYNTVVSRVWLQNQWFRDLVISVDYASVIQRFECDEVFCCKRTFVRTLHGVSIVRTQCCTYRYCHYPSVILMVCGVIAHAKQYCHNKLGQVCTSTLPIVRYLFMKVFPPILPTLGLQVFILKLKLPFQIYHL